MTKEDLIKKKISAISLGCDKNRVDLEHMLSALQQYGFEITNELENAEIIIVNTCAFIQPAIVESAENIELATNLKNTAKVEKVIVSGCLPMREKDIINKYFPNVDAFITLKDNEKITEIIEDLYSVKKTKFSYNKFGRILTTAGSYAYLKIAEGCSNGCAYCTIPRIRGRFTSVPMKDLIQEAKLLGKMGYKELIIVAQDTARYGEDIYGKPALIDLLKELIKIKEIKWVRLQYIYPEWLTKELLDFISNTDKMCKYIDMPLQHIDDKILKAMNRKTGEEKSRNLVNLINEKYPEITLRSTFIVGLPTETRKKFKKLYDFIAEGKITYASFFPYYREENTKAYFMPKQVPKFIKNLRLKKLENLQNKIINLKNLEKIGQIEDVIIDDYDEDKKIFIAHSQKNSPNIDLYVILDAEDSANKGVELGEIYKVKLTDLHELGFKGEKI